MYSSGVAELMTVVVFTQQGARIYHGNNNIKKFIKQENVLVNPVIPRRVPPHLWIMKDNKISTITQADYDRLNPEQAGAKSSRSAFSLKLNLRSLLYLVGSIVVNIIVTLIILHLKK